MHSIVAVDNNGSRTGAGFLSPVPCSLCLGKGARLMSQQHCMRCGGGDAAVIIDDDATLCGNCFLDEALRRRRRLSPAPRWRAPREKLMPMRPVLISTGTSVPTR